MGIVNTIVSGIRKLIRREKAPVQGAKPEEAAAKNESAVESRGEELRRALSEAVAMRKAPFQESHEAPEDAGQVAVGKSSESIPALAPEKKPVDEWGFPKKAKKAAPRKPAKIAAKKIPATAKKKTPRGHGRQGKDKGQKTGVKKKTAKAGKIPPAPQVDFTKQVFDREKEMAGYRRTIENLSEEIRHLREEVVNQNVQPKEALAGIKSIYTSIQTQKRDIDLEIKRTKSLMDFLEQSFLQRKIDEATFRARMQDYREKMHLLQIEKKELLTQKDELKTTTQEIPTAQPVSLERLANTKNIEELLIRQQASLEKITEQHEALVSRIEGTPAKDGGAAGPKASWEPPAGRKRAAETVSGAGKYGAAREAEQRTSGKAREKIVGLEDSMKRKETSSQTESAVTLPGSGRIAAFMEHKAGGKINVQKLEELERKVGFLMEKYSISEREVEEKLGGASTTDALESINRLINIMELEKRANIEMNRAEKISTAMRVTKPQAKKAEDVVGIATEIKKHRLVTDFDNVMTFIASKGKARFPEISKELGIPAEKVEECCGILRDGKLVEILYPPFGEPVAMTLDYREKEALEKLRKKNEKAKGKVV